MIIVRVNERKVFTIPVFQFFPLSVLNLGLERLRSRVQERVFRYLPRERLLSDDHSDGRNLG